MMVFPASLEYLSPPELFSFATFFNSCTILIRNCEGYFSSSRRAFQSGRIFSTSAQNFGL